MITEYFAYNYVTDGENSEYLDVHNAGIGIYGAGADSGASAGADSGAGAGAKPPHTLRERGRKDFQLIYIHGGKMSVTLQGEKRAVYDSHCILYAPGERQDYEPLPTENSTICWVHFNGSSAREILLDTGLNTPIFAVERSEEIYALFRRLISVLRATESSETEGKKTLSRSILLQLFCLISKAKKPSEKSEKAKAENAKKSARRRERQEITPALDLIELHLGERYTLSRLAAACALSKSAFLRKFKRVTGVSPIAYANERKLSAALFFLTETADSIVEIACRTGFENQFYFSTCFKKKFGCSPSEYRKKSL